MAWTHRDPEPPAVAKATGPALARGAISTALLLALAVNAAVAAIVADSVRALPAHERTTIRIISEAAVQTIRLLVQRREQKLDTTDWRLTLRGPEPRDWPLSNRDDLTGARAFRAALMESLHNLPPPAQA
ncbi:MAG: hypothetical protein SFY95_04470 [Planctomycetota bacterium]|nr:hypothetical protein [Planctomycetota bacterium]